jgi:hypothetical protein
VPRDDLPELPWIADVDPPPGPLCTRTLSAPVSYLRVMENMTDVGHTPFVHRGILPVGRRIVGLEASVEDDVIRMSGTLAAASRRGRDVPFSVRIRMPTVATFEILPGVQFVVIVTPVDRDRCWMWARYSQRFVPAWLGGGLVTRLVASLDLHAIFRRQDIPVLAGQQLDDPGDISGYRLLEMDRGAAMFFSLRRQALARAAGAMHPAPPSRRTGSEETDPSAQL